MQAERRMPGGHVVYSSENYEVSPEPHVRIDCGYAGAFLLLGNMEPSWQFIIFFRTHCMPSGEFSCVEWEAVELLSFPLCTQATKHITMGGKEYNWIVERRKA